MPTELRGLHAIVLIADRFDEQVYFYETVLGLEVVSKLNDAAFMRVGSQTLAIFARSHHPEGTRRLGKARHGISHLEFAVDRDDEAAITARLDAANARAYGDNFQDADGNLFHFHYSDRGDND